MSALALGISGKDELATRQADSLRTTVNGITKYEYKSGIDGEANLTMHDLLTLASPSVVASEVQKCFAYDHPRFTLKAN